MKIKYLTFEQRKQIERMYEENVKPEDIAKVLGVTSSTIYQELKRGKINGLDANGRYRYSSLVGQTTFNRNLHLRGNKKKKGN